MLIGKINITNGLVKDWTTQEVLSWSGGLTGQGVTKDSTGGDELSQDD